MSADNWTICPKCEQRELEKAQKRQAVADAAYGKVTPDEYQKLRDAVKGDIKLGESLREDYQLGIRGNRFFVEYRAYCEVCRFSFEYKDECIPAGKP